MSGYLYAQPTWGQWFVNTVTSIPKYLWSWITWILDLIKNFICAGTFWSYLVLLGLVVCTVTFASLYFRQKTLAPTCPTCPNANTDKLLTGPVMITSV